MQVFAGAAAIFLLIVNIRNACLLFVCLINIIFGANSNSVTCKDELCSCKLYCTVRTLEIRHKPSSVFNMRAGIGFQMGALYEACTYRCPRLVVGLLSAILHVTRGCGGDVEALARVMASVLSLL